MIKRTRTKHIVVHCSATRPSQDIGAAEIRKWHKAQGWEDIGYHYVIRRDGKVERGRALDAVGAHVAGHNSTTVGVCMVGGVDQKDFTKPVNNFTKPQWAALKQVCADLVARYPDATILGHRDFPKVAKACPCFDARDWAIRQGLPAAK